jgi:glyoxylase-like metal-dependent hydrolase (beta-lactamase superfamily II)
MIRLSQMQAWAASFCVLFASSVGACDGKRAAIPVNPSWHFIPGSYVPGSGPDGNSVFLDARDGLILIDTGRHPAHQETLLRFADKRGKPIAAIVNTHWHLDHAGGNAEIRAVWPEAPLYTSTAIEGALTGFFEESRVRVAEFLETGQASSGLKAEIDRDLAAMDDPDSLRATIPVMQSGEMLIAGRALTVKLARYAVTEGDVWIYEPNEQLVIAGDLVVAMVPFMDTACAEGWRDALDEISAVSFETLIPGHGEPMSRDEFLRWRGAFNNLLDCAAGNSAREACIDGWTRDAAEFIPAGETRVESMVGYYIDTRLRAEPEERLRYCER